MNIIDLDVERDFQECFTRTAGAVAECHCGRTHVAINSCYFEQLDEDGDGQMVADFQKQAETDDKIIIRTDLDSIGLIEVGGHEFAEDCECEGWTRYKDFILSHRSEIKDFLIRVASAAQRALEQEKTFNILKNKELKVLDDHRY